VREVGGVGGGEGVVVEVRGGEVVGVGEVVEEVREGGVGGVVVEGGVVVGEVGVVGEEVGVGEVEGVVEGGEVEVEVEVGVDEGGGGVMVWGVVEKVRGRRGMGGLRMMRG
ncbi:hypothetical protein, partial [Micrococcus luteus]|uniref:hypothetical protein n=1 Tax=Micrococcus luteus TaxID=1270 RepID=UPI001642FDB1